ncbi:hypothetical protein JHK85_041095 [Glycine max]|nr:hypothetical protein JHK86_040504 [Glycine max]KAG4966120.1 hypothetical protein JHK85_041095 [Glycine max]
MSGGVMKDGVSGGATEDGLMVIWDDSDGEKSSSPDDEQANICVMPYTKEKFKLKKSNEDLKKKIQTLEESLSQANKNDDSSRVEQLIEEIACLKKRHWEVFGHLKNFNHAFKIRSTSP